MPRGSRLLNPRNERMPDPLWGGGGVGTYMGEFLCCREGRCMGWLCGPGKVIVPVGEHCGWLLRCWRGACGGNVATTLRVLRVLSVGGGGS